MSAEQQGAWSSAGPGSGRAQIQGFFLSMGMAKAVTYAVFVGAQQSQIFGGLKKVKKQGCSVNLILPCRQLYQTHSEASVDQPAARLELDPLAMAIGFMK